VFSYIQVDFHLTAKVILLGTEGRPYQIITSKQIFLKIKITTILAPWQLEP